MTANTKIEWADHTFNPWTGCTKVSPACDHCYAESWSKRAGDRVGKWGAGAPRVRTTAANWKQPLRWNADAERLGVRHRVFCASLADVFDNEVPTEWRGQLWALINATPHLDWLLLTKRVGNVTTMMYDAEEPQPNVWIGATICNQAEADRDIPKLLAVPAAKRFLSMEPLLGPVDLVKSKAVRSMCKTCAAGQSKGCVIDQPGPFVDWVIVGGESGPSARPMHPDWARSLRDQCQVARVPFLFKQHGEWLATAFCDDEMAHELPSRKTVYVRRDGDWHDGRFGVDFFGGDEETAWVGKKAAGRRLDGREWNEVPS